MPSIIGDVSPKLSRQARMSEPCIPLCDSGDGIVNTLAVECGEERIRKVSKTFDVPIRQVSLEKGQGFL